MSLHVIPQHDEHPHTLTDGCACCPTVEWADPRNGVIYSAALVVHHAFDSRETCEEATGEGLSPDHGWLIVDEEGRPAQ